MMDRPDERGHYAASCPRSLKAERKRPSEGEAVSEMKIPEPVAGTGGVPDGPSGGSGREEGKNVC